MKKSRCVSLEGSRLSGGGGGTEIFVLQTPMRVSLK